VLACLLGGKGMVFDGEVVDHQVIISGLGVYRREEGEETNKYTATKGITKHDDLTQCYR
jgi:hypothetical protein